MPLAMTRSRAMASGLHASCSVPQAFFIVGPTASGKSAVAQYIAEREGQLIVSADSMNLYRGMDIGTAKPSLSERSKVDYAGVDLVEPSDKFSVAAYLEAVQPAFESGREIIVAGGTGLYVKCLTEGFDEVPPENPVLRAALESLDFYELEKRAKEEAAGLYAALTADDRENPRRLIRILERSGGGSTAHSKWNSRPKPAVIGLHVEREVLVKRIAQRVDQMYAAGLLDEARALMQRELSPTALQAIGYAEAFAVLRNEMNEEDAREKTTIRTRQLAKRQMTWLRNQLNVVWIDAMKYSSRSELAGAVSSAWKKTGPTKVQF
jgi:tRNA dimethylallyltransferase